MDKFNIKSILLGIGIGIIFTSIVSLIYFQGSGPYKDPDEKEMARLAEKYGYTRQASQRSDQIFIEGSQGAAATTK